MKRFPGQKGQIVIPALFLFPTLMLFVFLIFETAKLSREKIRHQFAVDAAAFVEMTNYSDFLNRSAYVNGAFPMRIFREGFHETMLDCLGRALWMIFSTTMKPITGFSRAACRIRPRFSSRIGRNCGISATQASVGA